MPDPLPYRIASLCDLRDERGRVLLLRRAKAPNQGLCSPVGGKLDMTTGESPAQNAQREIHEETGLDIPLERIHLMGIVAETAYEGRGHWLMFVFRVLGSVWVEPHDMREGRLDWYEPERIGDLALPETDRRIIWPLICRVAPQSETDLPGFFSVHIDCRGDDLSWTVEECWSARPGVRAVDDEHLPA
jgi:8-oxo-dGTP diphosphatase